MFDPSRLLDQFLGARGDDGRRAGPSSDTKAGLAAGALAGLLLGSRGGRRMVGGGLRLGGTAVLAGLAYKAYQDWQAKKSGGAPQSGGSSGGSFLSAEPAARNDAALAILRAMIAAAKSDGHVDAQEQQRIFAKLDEAGMDTDAKAFIVDELRKPLDIDAVVHSATSPELAAEIYAASVVAIDPDDPGEKAYLDMLAARLKLEAGLRAQIESAAKAASAG
jgi:uncharacterized membrane protein YebE (DUF533 family)